MTRRSASRMGALHPVLFFMMVYGISIFLAFFVCRTVYYSLSNEEESSGSTRKKFQKKLEMTSSTVNVAVS